jgi:hypothetical protein
LHQSSVGELSVCSPGGSIKKRARVQSLNKLLDPRHKGLVSVHSNTVCLLTSRLYCLAAEQI